MNMWGYYTTHICVYKHMCVAGTGDHCIYQWVYYHIIIASGQATASTFCRFYKKTIPAAMRYLINCEGVDIGRRTKQPKTENLKN